MTGEGRQVRRRINLTILLTALVAVAVGIAALGLLLPQPQPLPTTGSSGSGATCAHPRPAEVPVSVGSAMLYSCPEVFDGRVVRLAGEAVGDLLRGPDGRRWVQVNDDGYAAAGPLPTHFQHLGTNAGIAVLLPDGVAPAWLGGPGVRGDVLQVTGTFEVAAAADQGGTALIARTVRVQQAGEVVVTPPNIPLRVAAVAALALTAWLAWQVRRRA